MQRSNATGRSTATMPIGIADLADATRAAVAALDSPLVASFLAEWPQRPRTRRVEPRTLPVLRCLATIAEAAVADTGPQVVRDLVAAVLRSAGEMAWRQTYTQQESSADFLDNYGYAELLGLNGPQWSERLAAGFLLLGADTFYPRHRHAAEELYLPLYGRADWQQGDTVWRAREPGTLIHHRSEEPHAMRTGANPLLALYLWRGADLALKSRLGE